MYLCNIADETETLFTCPIVKPYDRVSKKFTVKLATE